MDETLTFIKSLFKPQEQWPMSYAENEPGMSLPEYHPEETEETNIVPPALAAEDTYNPDELIPQLRALLADVLPKTNNGAVPDDITKALDKLLGANEDTLNRARKDMYLGAMLKTTAAASDLFTRAVGLPFQLKSISSQRDTALQNYQNQMDAIDNQVLYMKHQLADRFNKTVENNIMSLAAKNLRVTSGGVLDMSKDYAQEVTEDMRELDYNARLKKIALDAGKESTKVSAKYAKSQLFTGLAQSALKLGIMWETGGGTNETFGDLYKGYKKAKGIQ